MGPLNFCLLITNAESILRHCQITLYHMQGLFNDIAFSLFLLYSGWEEHKHTVAHARHFKVITSYKLHMVKNKNVSSLYSTLSILLQSVNMIKQLIQHK